MKMKLKALGLPYTTGILIKPISDSDSATGYQAEEDGVNLKYVFYQETTGMIEGSRLGKETNAWIAKADFCGIEPQEEDKIIIFGQTYNILGIQNKVLSEFEDHYQLSLLLPNT